MPWKYIFPSCNVSSKSCRSSGLQMFFKIGAFKNFTIFIGKHLCRSVFVIKLQALRPASLLRSDSNTGIFLRIFWNFWEQLFYRTLPVVSSRVKSGDNFYLKNTLMNISRISHGTIAFNFLEKN